MSALKAGLGGGDIFPFVVENCAKVRAGLKFADHRSRPAMDLMGRLDPGNGARPGHAIYDLGCGAGNISRLIQWVVARLPASMPESAAHENSSTHYALDHGPARQCDSCHGGNLRSPIQPL